MFIDLRRSDALRREGLASNVFLACRWKHQDKGLHHSRIMLRLPHSCGFTTLAVCALLFCPMPSRGVAGDVAPQAIALPGIHNAFRVTPRVLAGSQPEGDAAFAALAQAGVKTIISVDGARPDVEAARKHGLRYVHLPIGYDGIPASRVAELVRAAAPPAGTIFVHCHHGKHRGPAAVGVICEAMADWSPERAGAWLRQAGTAAEYSGLFRAVREFRTPSPAELARIGELPEVAETPMLVDVMVAIDQRLDALKAVQTAGWPREAANDATLLSEELRELARTDGTARRPTAYRRLLADSEKSVAVLREVLRVSPADHTGLDNALKQTSQSCTACHKAYRNEKP